MAKGAVRGLVGSFEREAIRPHLGGHFDRCLRVTHLQVDLPRCRIALHVLAKPGEGSPVFGDDTHQDQHCEHPGIGPEVVPEVVVTAVLPTEDRIRFRHDLFDVAVPHPGPDRLASGLGDDLSHRP